MNSLIYTFCVNIVCLKRKLKQLIYRHVNILEALNQVMLWNFSFIHLLKHFNYISLDIWLGIQYLVMSLFFLQESFG
jgi:hypothetical protein